ncbi:MAG: phosphatidylserine decarboxylase [Arcobacteraceae bacterium]
MHITNTISQQFGKFAKKEFPSFFQNIINRAYVYFLGLDMSEFKDPTSYKSLNALFTRALNEPRIIDASAGNFISCADSFVTACGHLEHDKLLQIKGMQYNISELLTSHISKENVKKVNNGMYMNFYLSPKDYHRYHASLDCKITKLIHVPGKLYPVNFKYLNKQLNLFIENERVILECVTNENKLFYMIFVGALNVGQMVFTFEPSVETNCDTSKINVIEYDNLEVKKGDCLGYFKMGSTVVMVWEKNSVTLKDLTNQKVSFGTIVANN